MLIQLNWNHPFSEKKKRKEKKISSLFELTCFLTAVLWLYSFSISNLILVWSDVVGASAGA
jgi:bacteriorhodopsin